jgi:hypothetical protein
VYTIDVVGSDVPVSWHSRKCSADDPAAGRACARAELLAPFQGLVERRVAFLTGRSSEMVTRIEEPIDFAFLDGSPRYEDVSADARLVLERARPGARLVFDGADPTDEVHTLPAWLNRLLLGRELRRFLGRRMPRPLIMDGPRAGYEGLVYKRSRCPGVTRAISELASAASLIEIVPMPDVSGEWSRGDYGAGIVTLRGSASDEQPHHDRPAHSVASLR